MKVQVPMKYLILSGGLGNQMFEYAFYLSCKNKGIKLKLNRDLYEVSRMHNGYLLGHVFGVPESEVTKSSKLSVFITRIIHRYHPAHLVYSDTPMMFSEKAFRTNRIFIDGCFINPLYFESIRELISKAFVFREIDSYNMCLGERMLSDNSVSIHIRRGDYLNNPVYGVCNEDYYEKAIRHIEKQVSNPSFFVFSDDLEWSDKLMRYLGVNYKLITINTGVDSYKDMYLMTRCRHNIIANSTFSWWGAWLNNNPGKIVIAPNKWTTSIYMDKTEDCWNQLEV